MYIMLFKFGFCVGVVDCDCLFWIVCRFIINI